MDVTKAKKRNTFEQEREKEKKLQRLRQERTSWESLPKHRQAEERKTLLAKLESIGGDVHELQEADPWTIQENISMQEFFNSKKAELQEQVYTMELMTEQKEPDDLRDDIIKLQEYRNIDVSEIDVESDSYRKRQNLVLMRENRLRERLGLDPKPLLMLTSDLETLLLLDDGKIGNTCQEWLSKVSPNMKQEYKQRLEELIRVKSVHARQIQREREFLEEIQEGYEEIKESKPKSKTIGTGTEMTVNPQFIEWLASVKALRNKIRPKIQAVQSIESDPDLNVTYDRRSSTFRIYEALNKILRENE